MKPQVLKETHKNREIKIESKDRTDLVEGGMYTDLWEIWDVTLIYSNLLSSKNKKKKIKGGGKVESHGEDNKKKQKQGRVY